MDVPTVNVSTRCTEVADVLEARLNTVIANRKALTESLAIARDDYVAAIAKLHEGLEEHKHAVLSRAKDAHTVIIKNIESSVDERTITASQLRTCAAMCQSPSEAMSMYAQRLVDAGKAVLSSAFE